MALLSGNFLTENNQSVETDIGGWTAGPLSTSAVQSTDQAHSGTHSIKVTRNSTAPTNSLVNLETFGNYVYVVPGQVLNAYFWVYTATASSYNFAIDWYKSDGSTYVNTTTGSTVSATVNSWTQIGAGDTHTVPALAYIGKMYIQGVSGLANGNTCYLDDIFVGMPTTSPMKLTTTTAWTAPAGVTSVQVECWGAGGAGGSGSVSNAAGGGGAGGSYSKKNSYTVTPGTTYTVTVGLGGFFTTPATNTASNPGDDTWFDSTSGVIAKGGAGGGDRSTAGNGTAGTGSTTGNIGDVVFAGGNGSVGASATIGGGGGGGAGDSAAGGNASGSTAGTGGSSGGGAGSAGVSAASAANGTTPGGGGGGARATSTTDRNGGNGGNGQVILTWSAGPTGASDSDTSSSAESQSIAASLSDGDTSAGAESESIAASLSDGDTTAGAETATIGVSDAETAAGGETQSISASSADTDTGAGSETATIGVSDADTVSGAESEGIVQGASDLSEGSGGAESQSISATFSDGESATGGETWSLVVSVSDTDTVTGVDTELATGSTTPSSTEGAGGGESESIQIFWDPIQEKSLVMGPATLYIAPFGATEPALSAVSSAPDSAVWTDLGGTLGGVDLIVEQEFIEVEIKQIPDQPMRRLKKRRMTIKTSLAEATLLNLGYVLNDTTSGSSGTGWSAFSPQSRSEASQLSYSALIVDGWAPGFQLSHKHKRRRLIVRKCLSIDNVEFGYSKDGQTVYTVTWSCHYVDSTTPPFRIVDGT